MARGDMNRWILVLWGVFSACLPAGASPREFLEASQSWLATQPRIVKQEAMHEWAGVTYAGFDPASGAWFMAGGDRASGRQPDGVLYQFVNGQPSQASFDPLPFQIAHLIPSTIVASLHERPERITGAELVGGEHWAVTYRTTAKGAGATPATKEYLVRFDASTGRVLSQERVGVEDSARIEFDLSDPRIERVIRSPDGPEYEITFEDAPNAEMFVQSAVMDRMRAASIETQQRLAAISAGYVGSDGRTEPGAEQEASVLSYSQAGRWGKYRLPLVLVGGVILALAGFEMYRRRAA